MPKGQHKPAVSDVRSLVADFTARLAALVEENVREHAHTTVLAALGGHEVGNGRRKNGQTVLLGKARKKAPLQLCPVPGCKNPAAPVFGMVCKKHKDVPKAKIEKYREARRAKALKAAA